MSSLPERPTRSRTDPVGAGSLSSLTLAVTGLAAAVLVAALEAFGSVHGVARVLLEAIALPALCAPPLAWWVLRPHRRRIAQQLAAAHETRLALESSEARQRAVLRAAPDPILVVDERAIVESANPAVTEVFGWRPDELVGRPLSVLVPDRDHARHSTLVRRWLAGGRPPGGPPPMQRVQAVRKDGSTLVVEVGLSEVEIGVSRRLVGVVRDLSRSLRAEQELKQQLAQLRALHRLSEALARGESVNRICEEAVAGACDALGADRGAVMLVDGAGRLEYRAWRGLSEAHRRAVQEERPWIEVVPEDEGFRVGDVEALPVSSVAREMLLREGIRASLVHPVGHEGRRMGFLKLHWNAPRTITDEEARFGVTIARAVGLVVQRTRQEESLERLAQAVDATEDAVLLTDARGVIRRVNPAFTRVTGWTAAEVVGNTPRVLRSPQTREEMHAEMWRTITGGRTWSGRLVDRRKDGREYHAALSIAPVFDGQRRITGFVGVQRDVSLEIEREDALRRAAGQLEATNRELRAAKETAESAARAKSEFLAAMSHEIRTPMNGVLGFTHLLADTALDPRQREYVSIIQGSGRALLAIINDILDLSKIEAGRLELEPRPYDLRRAGREVVGLLGPQAAQKGLDLGWAADDDVPDVLLGDEGRVRQVLTNLLGNAIKFTETGSVRLRLARAAAGDAPGFVRVSVEDTGIGIALEQLGLLFQNFSQVDRSMSRRFGGTGLGLAISRRLVDMMGGRIGVDSEPGRGSTFWFTLPVPAGTLHLPEVPATGPEGFTLVRSREAERPVRVLVADDNSVNQLLARSLLERFGCRVDVAANGLEAVEMVRRIGYDLVFMDCQMPEMDGFEATRAIRAAAGDGPRVPIVALTASALPEDRERALGAGMDDFLPKPLVPADLAHCVTRWAA